MVAHTRRALDLAIQFRKAIALDLVTVSAQESYDLLKAVVRQGAEIIKAGGNIRREHIDAAKTIVHMSGVSEPARETHDKDAARMSLAELEAMIKDLKVIDSAPVYNSSDDQDIDIFS